MDVARQLLNRVTDLRMKLLSIPQELFDMEQDRPAKRQKKKYRKNKKAGEDDSMDDADFDDMGFDEYGLASLHGDSSADLAAEEAANKFALPLFMDTSRVPTISRADTTHHQQLAQFPTYTATAQRDSPSTGNSRQYRCRGRIGRGGRFVIDRVTHLRSQHPGDTLQSTISMFVGNMLETPVDYGVQRRQLLVQPKVDASTQNLRASLKEIYSMSDSEDEMLEGDGTLGATERVDGPPTASRVPLRQLPQRLLLALNAESVAIGG